MKSNAECKYYTKLDKTNEPIKLCVTSDFPTFDVIEISSPNYFKFEAERTNQCMNAFVVNNKRLV